MEKLCKVCKEQKPISDYYIAYKNNNTNIYTSLCKPCHNKKKTEYNRNKQKIIKPNSFMKLEESKRNQILEDVKNKINYKEIARKNDIKYHLMIFWKKKGYLTPPTQIIEELKTEPNSDDERCHICRYLEFNCHCGTGYGKYT